MVWLDRALELAPEPVHAGFNRSKILFVLHGWDEGFGAVSNTLARSRGPSIDFGDAPATFSLISRLSKDDDRLQSQIGILVNLYNQAAEYQRFCRGDHEGQRC